MELSGKLMALRELLWDAGIGERYRLRLGGGVIYRLVRSFLMERNKTVLLVYS